MRERLSIVSKKGQVTLPAEFRDALGIKEGDKVAFVLDGEGVRVVRKGSVVDATAGVLKTKRRFTGTEEERQAIEKAIAESVADRSIR